MSTSRDPGIDLDLMAAAAQTRLAAFINRKAAQHMRRMRESWDMAAPSGNPATPAEAQLTTALCCVNELKALGLSTMPPKPATTAAPYPWCDTTPTKGDDYSDDEMSIAEFVIELICLVILIFATGFAAGYFSTVH